MSEHTFGIKKNGAQCYREECFQDRVWQTMVLVQWFGAIAIVSAVLIEVGFGYANSQALKGNGE